MYLRNIGPFTAGREIQSMYRKVSGKSAFALTVNDRTGIEKLLRDGASIQSQNPELLAGLLRHKLRSSRCEAEPADLSLVISGSRVTYRIADAAPRTGILTMSATPMPGCIMVASLLGATMIGMELLQTAPLIRDTHEIVTLTVLDVAPPQYIPLSV